MARVPVRAGGYRRVVAYLDAASTEPLHPVAREALSAAFASAWADPSRLYSGARRSRMLLDAARASVAGILGARPDEVSFPASGTQALHLAVLGVLARRRPAGRVRAVASAVEHSAVLHALRQCERDLGVRIDVVPVDRTGRLDLEAFLTSLDDGRPPALACVQSGNHEVGTLQPVEEVAEACAQLGVPLLVDAAQSLGRVPVPTGWALLTASAHKWGGPAGIGVLAVRREARWRSPLPDDDREQGRVPGFENVPAVLAATTSLEAVVARQGAESARLHDLVGRIRERVPLTVPDVEVLGHPVQRLPHLVTFSCLYVDGEALVTELDRAGFAVSSGSSCTASALRPSHVLEAMGALTHGNVRVSLPRGTTAADVDAFLATLPAVVASLRESAGVAGL